MGRLGRARQLRRCDRREEDPVEPRRPTGHSCVPVATRRDGTVGHDVFISYSSPDKAIAEAVCSALEKRGISCWVAPRNIEPGADWGESIIDALNRARVFVLIFSQSANQSPQLKREVERAVSRSTPIIPVRIENVAPSKSLEYFISTQHWLDAYTKPLSRHLGRLGDAVERALQTDNPSPASHPKAESWRKGISKRLAVRVAAAAVVCLFAVVVWSERFTSFTLRSANEPSAADGLRRDIEVLLPSMSCAWLDAAGISAEGSTTSVRLVGAAGSAAAVSAAFSRLAITHGAPLNLNLDGVAPIDVRMCTPLDAFAGIRRADSSGNRWIQTDRFYVIKPQANGIRAARSSVRLDLRGIAGEFALFGLEPSGAITTLLPGREALKAILASKGSTARIVGPDQYELQLDSTHPGWSGLLMISGKGSVDTALIATPATQRAPDWLQRFHEEAALGDWKAEMVWFETFTPGR